MPTSTVIGWSGATATLTSSAVRVVTACHTRTPAGRSRLAV
jgi:hypothetical protein